MRVSPAAEEAGFTLVEALFAMVILIFGLLAVTNLLIVGASSNSVANQS
jgi:Tfp pilus assembly protein PilV